MPPFYRRGTHRFPLLLVPERRRREPRELQRVIVLEYLAVPLRNVLMQVAEFEPVVFGELIGERGIGAVLVQEPGAPVAAEVPERFVIKRDPEWLTGACFVRLRVVVLLLFLVSFSAL